MISDSEKQAQYQSTQSTLNRYADTCYNQMVALGIAAGKAFEKSESAGKSKIVEYNKMNDEWIAAKAAAHYHSNYANILMNSVKSFGTIDRFNSEWHTVYAKIKSDLETEIKTKVQLERKMANSALSGEKISSTDVERLSEATDNVTKLQCCKTLHEILYETALNHNSQVTKHRVGESLTCADRSGTSYTNVTILSIVTYEQAKSVDDVDSIASTMPEPYNTFDKDLTLFYICEEPYTPPPADDEDGETSEPEPPPTPTQYVLWDKIIVE